MKLKKTFIILICSVAIFATDYKYLEKNKANISNFKSLEYKQADVSKYKNLMKKGKPQDFSNLNKDTEYLTKKEFKKVKANVNKYTKYITLKKDFILYLTSDSVPTNTMLNILFQVGILQDNGFNILTKQYYKGMNKNFKEYLFKIQDKINEKPSFVREKIIKNSGVKVDPRFFEYFDLKKAPALILAECTGLVPTFKSCEFKFLLRGDTSLESFFDKIRKLDPKYEKYYQVLLANKFDDKEVQNYEKK